MSSTRSGSSPIATTYRYAMAIERCTGAIYHGATMNRRQFNQSMLGMVAAGVSVRAMASAPASQSTRSAPSTLPAVPDNLRWQNVQDWGIEGRGFADTLDYFDRLPARAKPLVREELWNLSRHSAGMCVRFTTDATQLFIRYELINANLAMPHMPATGVSGVDLYAELDGHWRWAATVQPRVATVEQAMAKALLPGRRRYQVNLPLYNGVKRMEVGVAPDAVLEPEPPRKRKPILFYGTSITQGACASRPGMAFTQILARRLDLPALNFGFSGNGRTELEVGRFLSEIDAALFVLDCVANTSPEQITERTAPLVKLLRQDHPAMPILLVEDRTWADAPVATNRSDYHKLKRDALKAAFESLQHDGVPNLHYCAGDDLIGSDGEGTVDGSHPNDLGMMRYADALEPTLRKLLERS